MSGADSISTARARNEANKVADLQDPGSPLRTGDYFGWWERHEHPYGQPDSCPFCCEPVEYTQLFYNGPGSPPSYAICCGNCGAQGPTSHGGERGDHIGARFDAVRLWNARSKALSGT